MITHLPLWELRQRTGRGVQSLGVNGTEPHYPFRTNRVRLNDRGYAFIKS